MTPTPAARLAGIEAARGIAAALVVFHHAGSIVTQPRFFGVEGFAGHLANFNVGVDFFFVLSGFIITWVHWADIGRPERLPRYAIRRFVRIYPPYWTVVVPLVILYQLLPSAGVPSQRDPLNIAFSLALLPFPQDPVLGVAWTLVHEMLFYTLFGLLIFTGRTAIFLLPLWGAGIVLADFFQPLRFPWSFFLSAYNIEFLLGIAAALALKTMRIPCPKTLLATGVSVFSASMLFGMHIQDDPLVGRLVFGLSAMVFILGMVEWERSSSITIPAPLRLLGASSYAIYLVHPVAISLGANLVSRLVSRTVPIELAIVALAGIGILAGCLYHLWLERPLTTVIRRRLGRAENLRQDAPSTPLARR